MLYAHFSEHNCFASICLIKHGISSKELLWNLQKKGLEDYFLTGSSSNLNGIHVQFQRPGWKMAPHKEGKSTWGMGKDLDCPRSCCDSHFDFKEMSFFDLKLAIPIRSYHGLPWFSPFFCWRFSWVLWPGRRGPGPLWDLLHRHPLRPGGRLRRVCAGAGRDRGEEGWIEFQGRGGSSPGRPWKRWWGRELLLPLGLFRMRRSSNREESE